MSDQLPLTAYTPGKETIGELLSLTNPSLVVPDWQRNYSWKNEHAEVFWNDLVQFFENKQNASAIEYFLGSVVIVKTSENTLRVLDGQQRLATSAILLSSIRDFLRGYKPEAAKQIQQQYLVGYDFLEEKTIHKLRLNVYDRDFFRRLILNERDGDYSEPEPEIASHKLIFAARKFFEAQLTRRFDGMSPQERYEGAMKLMNCLLKSMTVIAVTSTDEDSAAEIFETLNDRGIGLSTPDLLRNLVIRRADPEVRETIVDLWGEIVSFESDASIKSFLRHFWVSRYGDVKTQSLYREIKSVIERDEIRSIDLTTEISDSAKRYKQLIEANTPSEDFNVVLREFAEFGAAARLLLPGFLGVFETLSGDDIPVAARTLLNLYVRHSIIVSGENSLLENIVYAATRSLRIHKSSSNFIEELRQGAPTDDSVVAAFKKLSIKHNGSRRALLKRFEIHRRGTEELDVANPSRVHVEHIYPQTPKPDQKWQQHAQLIDRVGNLALLSARLNTSIKNGSFEEKRTALSSSEIITTREIASNIGWSPQLMESRQNVMAAIAPELWPV